MDISNVNPVGLNVTGISLPNNNPPQKEPSGSAPEGSKPVSSEAVKQMLEQIQNNILSRNISVSFSTYGDKNNEICIVVREKDTGKILREIPPEEIQKLSVRLGELIGIIFHHSA